MEKIEFKNLGEISIVLADDDHDDCLFFKEALDELLLSTKLITVHDGEKLMHLLNQLSTHHQNNNGNFPCVIFLDLNMPRKSGFDCLREIKQMDGLKHIPIVIFSTSLDMEVVDLLYNTGADYYIRKPGDFSALKNIILEALNRTCRDLKKPEREQFILQF